MSHEYYPEAKIVNLYICIDHKFKQVILFWEVVKERLNLRFFRQELRCNPFHGIRFWLAKLPGEITTFLLEKSGDPVGNHPQQKLQGDASRYRHDDMYVFVFAYNISIITSMNKYIESVVYVAVSMHKLLQRLTARVVITRCIFVTGWWFQAFLIFNPYLGKWSNLTDIFQMGWNHQLVCNACFPFDSSILPLVFVLRGISRNHDRPFKVCIPFLRLSSPVELRCCL